ncbi:MAG TPA: LacI family transcriptional regulator [Clostridiaceae bacterium]|nr:LacI family transcriptional regulator [Clostridiaceae bacterium]
MPSTILDVAALCGYSKATVTRAFAEPHLVKESTRNKVYEAARQLNYTPNAVAQAMQRMRTDNIAFILYEEQSPVILNPFYAPIVDAVLQTCHDLGLSVIISSSADTRLPNGEIYIKKQVDGAILAGQVNSELVEYFHNQKKPVVLLNNITRKEDRVCLAVADYRGALEAVQHLIDKGHRRIALVQGDFSSHVMEGRRQGYLDALRNNDLPLNEADIFCIPADYGHAISCLETILDERQPEFYPSAFFCTNDEIAVGIIKGLFRRGHKVPEEFGVVGFDDSILATTIEPELTTVSVDKRYMGSESVRLLHQLMQGEELAPGIHRVGAHLVVRGST